MKINRIIKKIFIYAFLSLIIITFSSCNEVKEDNLKKEINESYENHFTLTTNEDGKTKTLHSDKYDYTLHKVTHFSEYEKVFECDYKVYSVYAIENDPSMYFIKEDGEILFAIDRPLVSKEVCFLKNDYFVFKPYFTNETYIFKNKNENNIKENNFQFETYYYTSSDGYGYTSEKRISYYYSPFDMIFDFNDNYGDRWCNITLIKEDERSDEYYILYEDNFDSHPRKRTCIYDFSGNLIEEKTGDSSS